MRKLLASLTAMILVSIAVNAQPYLQQRGLYVNGFIKFRDVNASGSNLVVDQSRSILGVDLDQDGVYEKEVELIDYCKANHITYITLYDCGVPLAYITNNYRISTSDPGTHTFGWHLCRFINYCRSNCIDKIGVAGGGTAFFSNTDNFNNTSFPQTPVFQFPSYLVPSQLATTLNFVTQPIAPGDPQFEEAEITKVFLRAAFLPNLLAGCAHIDVLNLESEYWNFNADGITGPSQKWPNWWPILDYMNDIKYANNVTCGTCPPIYTEVYLGLLDNDNSPGIQNETIVGGFIDGNNSTHTSQKETDRILTHYYKNLNTTMPNDAGTVYEAFSTTNYYTKRFITFGSVGNPNSKIRPIYSAESIALGATVPFAGAWLQSDVRNNIFSAERQFHDAWMLDAYDQATPNLTARDNNVKPGASQWFTSSYMVHPLNNVALFTSTPVYSGGASGNVDFTFQGPIENEEEWNNLLGTIQYQFWVTDNSGATQYYPVSVGHPDIATVPYLTGSTSLNTGTTTYNITLPTSVQLSTTTNAASPYRAHLLINYPSSSCSLQMDQDVMVADGPSIISLSPSTHVCAGQSIYLRANTCGTTNYQWHRIFGTDMIVGGNTQDFVATLSGDYYCILSGGAGNCYGTTNSITITVDEVPTISSITPLCSGANITLTVNVSGTGTYNYYWSDDNHSTTSQITFPYPSTGTNVYSVNVTTQGTSCSSQQTITIPFKISLTSTGTTCQGNTITLTAPTTGSTGFITENLSNYLWTPGLQTSISIPVTANGTYSVSAIGNTTQCPYYSNPKVISFSQLPTATITTIGQTSYCQGAAINTVLNANTGANLTYQWQLNSANIGGATSSTYTAIAAGSYTVIVTNTITQCLNTSSPLVITVNSLPIPTITGNSNACLNDVLVYTTQSGQSNYTWAVTGGTYVSGGNSITVTWTTVGSGTVSTNYTDANGCTATSPTVFSVNVHALPTPTINGIATVCQGQTGVVYATQSGNSGYQWSVTGGNITSGSGTNSITVTWNTAGTGHVFVNYTDANGCTAASATDLIITVNPTPIVTASGPSTVCIGGSIQLSATTSAASPSFLWSSSTGFSSPLQFPLITNANLGNGGTYSVVVTSNGCSSLPSNIVTVTIDENCCGNPTNNILDQSDLPTSGTFTLPSGDYVLNSNITILNNTIVTFGSGTNISVGAGKKIFISNGGELILDGASLFPCNKMWKGIEVADQSSLVATQLTIMNNTQISGAEYAINIISNANVDIQSSTFDNNYLSVYFPVSASGHNGSFIFENNLVTQTSGSVLPPSYPSQTTTLGLKPLAGIEIHGAASIQIGTLGSATSFNTFSNMNAGIFSYNSNLTVGNSKFLNIVEDAIYAPTAYYNGSGIFADGSGGFYSLDVYGFGQGSGIDNFEGCKFGVFANIMSVSLKDNVMDTYNGPGGPVTMYTGCKAAFCDSRDISIVHNDMNCERYGVLLYYNYKTNSCEVVWNNIHFGSTTGISSSAGITCFEYGGHEGYTLISHNRIDYNQYGSDGIQIYTSSNMRIEYNEMYMTDNNFNLSGINILYSSGMDISCNTVIGASNPYTNVAQAAIKILKSSCLIGCNYTDKTYDGIFFSQPCIPTNLYGNAIYNHQIGLHLDAQAIIGSQLYQGNLWLGSYIQFGALNANPLGSYFNAGEYFSVNNNIIGGSVYALPPSISPAGTNNVLTSWFFTGTKVNFNCADPRHYYCDWYIQELFADTSNIDTLDKKIAEDRIHTQIFDNEIRWSLHKYLFDKLAENPALCDSDSLMMQFYTDMLGSNIEDLHQVGNETDEAMTIEQSLLTTIVQNTTNISSNLQQITDNEKQINIGNLTPVQIDNLKAINNNLRISIKSLTDFNSAAQDIIQSDRLLSVDQVALINGSISSTVLIETNQRQVNDIYLNTFAKNIYQFTPVQLTILYSIAAQCPVSGGGAVYQARSLLFYVDENLIYDDQYSCLQEGIVLRKMKSSANSLGNSYMYPNPTSSKATLIYSLPEESKGVLRIYSTVGEIVMQQTLNGKLHQSEISLATLNQGIYYYKVYLNNEIISTGKISIIK